MKKDIAEYLVDYFTDFAGEKHYVVMCALSKSHFDQDNSLLVGWIDNKSYTLNLSMDPCYDVYRSLSLGIAICNPKDDFDEEVGKKIAYNKANISDPVLYSIKKGEINSAFTQSYLRNKMDFLKDHPERFIATYSEAEENYKEMQNLVAEMNSLPDYEQEIMDKSLVGKLDLKYLKDLFDRAMKFL